MRKFLLAGWLLLALIPLPAAADPALPANLQARAAIVTGERDSWWEKTLVVSFPQPRRTLSTFDGFVEAWAVVNHSAHPLLWANVSEKFQARDGRGGKAYTEFMREQTARGLRLDKRAISLVATAADMDNLAVVSRDFAPLAVTVLVTAGARTNALRTGVDSSGFIEGEEPAGTINVILLTNARLTDGAMARAIVTVTEAKTAALQDLQVPSTYTPQVQATGTGTDSVIVVSGSDGPLATYTGGHSKLGELIGKATYDAVLEALEKQNGFRKVAR
ncbi:MAG TPA: adenosylcobinamide amidohydrolase [Azonexus sp.]